MTTYTRQQLAFLEVLFGGLAVYHYRVPRELESPLLDSRLVGLGYVLWRPHVLVVVVCVLG